MNRIGQRRICFANGQNLRRGLCPIRNHYRPASRRMCGTDSWKRILEHHTLRWRNADSLRRQEKDIRRRFPVHDISSGHYGVKEFCQTRHLKIVVDKMSH